MSTAIEARITMLEEVMSLQNRLAEKNDEIFELKRDGQSTIDDLNAQLDSERQRANHWMERHDSLGKGLILSAMVNLAFMSFLIWRAL